MHITHSTVSALLHTFEFVHVRVLAHKLLHHFSAVVFTCSSASGVPTGALQSLHHVSAVVHIFGCAPEVASRCTTVVVPSQRCCSHLYSCM